ncbi:Ohr family peroxiredoxin [Massilia niastensis]|uniref:Ohr family peroxiredoxin n=1 Tax=Massilia niastensis TaxID=544911 RepID=UPI00036D2C9A|nr:Ohr family peroxiredoxin [Massilia niastensis]
MTTIDTVLLTGATQTTLNRRDATRGHEGRLDIVLSSPGAQQPAHVIEATLPHPAAEQLFAGAWSACYITALGLVAAEKKVALPDDLAVGIEVDLGMTGAAYLLQARLNVSMPGVAQDVAEAIAHAADDICPYSKATRGNIDVAIKVVTA